MEMDCGMEALEGRRLCAVAVPQFDHIVVVVEENHPYSAIIGNSSAPFINKLANQGGLFKSSFAITHPSQPNYLALFSGSTQGITSDACPVNFPGPSLGGALIAAGKTFVSYSEDLLRAGSGTCAAGGYVRRHNPAADFADVPAQSNRPMSDFPARISDLPAVSFVIPNKAHDMHDGTIAAADRWLADHLGRYVRWAKRRNSLLIVTWDEDDGTSNNHIPTIFFGAHVKTGKYLQKINHYLVLRAIEESTSIPLLGSSRRVDQIHDVWE
ncbi:MAG TPA: alkaline phosphatase family protein [Tepidisphaeraceae bacterium]|nr:alkaline phosphatase family protein [Tepidisphaeraceae bacterium]